MILPKKNQDRNQTSCTGSGPEVGNSKITLHDRHSGQAASYAWLEPTTRPPEGHYILIAGFLAYPASILVLLSHPQLGFLLQRFWTSDSVTFGCHQNLQGLHHGVSYSSYKSINPLLSSNHIRASDQRSLLSRRHVTSQPRRNRECQPRSAGRYSNHQFRSSALQGEQTLKSL